MTDRSGNTKARPLLEEAIKLDPSFAMAYAGLAFVHLSDALMGWCKAPRECGRQAYVLANAAIELDDSLDTPHYVLGFVYGHLRKHDKALAEGKRAIELNPNGADARSAQGALLVWAGRPAEAVAFLDEAIRLNPIPRAHYYLFLGVSCWMTHKSDQAIAAFRKGLQIQPDHTLCLLHLAAALSEAGQQKEAREAAAMLLRLNPGFSLKLREKMLPWKDRAAVKRHIDALRKAGLN